MSAILDIIIVVIIAAAVIVTAKKGFVRTVFNIVGFVAAIVLSFTLSTPTADFIYDKALEPALSKAIENAVSDKVSSGTADISQTIWDALPSFVKNNAEKMNFNKNNLLNEAVGNTASEVSADVCKRAVKPLAVNFLKTTVTIVLLAVLSILFRFLAKTLNKLFSFSLVGTLNRTLGGILGLVYGLAWSAVFVLAVSLAVSLTGGFFCFTNEAVEASHIFKTAVDILPISIK